MTIWNYFNIIWNNDYIGSAHWYHAQTPIFRILTNSLSFYCAQIRVPIFLFIKVVSMLVFLGHNYYSDCTDFV